MAYGQAYFNAFNIPCIPTHHKEDTSENRIKINSMVLWFYWHKQQSRFCGLDFFLVEVELINVFYVKMFAIFNVTTNLN